MYTRLQSLVIIVHNYGSIIYFFFFQAEDGIRDKLVTGVQTCALPISGPRRAPSLFASESRHGDGGRLPGPHDEYAASLRRLLEVEPDLGELQSGVVVLPKEILEPAREQRNALTGLHHDAACVHCVEADVLHRRQHTRSVVDQLLALVPDDD